MFVGGRSRAHAVALLVGFTLGVVNLRMPLETATFTSTFAGLSNVSTHNLVCDSLGIPGQREDNVERGPHLPCGGFRASWYVFMALEVP